MTASALNTIAFIPTAKVETNFERLALDSLERVGLIMSPALLNTRSLAAELAGAVNNFRAISGLRPLKRTSLKTCSPCRSCVLVGVLGS